jgi:hypothetical protein
MIPHGRLIEWENRLRRIFGEIDDHLEDRYGGVFPLHPSRARRGTTASREHDGLFNIGASYSLGIGSSHGPGYVLEVRMVTLSHVPADVRQKIESLVAALLDENLPKAFPGGKVRVARDGNLYKIIGDLSLGTA